jgi:hypothetical protein
LRGGTSVVFLAVLDRTDDLALGLDDVDVLVSNEALLLLTAADAVADAVDYTSRSDTNVSSRFVSSFSWLRAMQ